MDEKNKNGLIVLSGGMDSVTLLYDKQDEIAMAVTFNYGSKHNAREIPFARLHSERLKIPHIVIDLDFMNKYFRSDLLQNGGNIPMGEYNEENMRNTVVPFRNGIMLSIAAGLAESYDLDKLFIANHFGDHAIYPDCRAAFIAPMSEAVTQGTSNGIKIIAPYTNIDKGQIAIIGKRLGLNYAETWSCYCGSEVQCGTCGTCIERREAMRQAGIDDPTTYLH
ncbi:7-cyano-7-deazaguanine synthase [Porphyromonas macacae]|nr:7-cyano-7-deazaguanine synthase QueC [Porphyromonas macacae]KGN75169.1 7-cyano-7-deazaguanine synthase [Porphyromonas macacae]